MLNEHNRHLQRLHAAGTGLGDDMRARKALLARLTAETAAVEEQRKTAQAAFDRLRDAAGRSRTAPVLDYVREAAAASALQREAASMQRRVGIARGELQRVRSGTSDTAVRAPGSVAFGTTLPLVSRGRLA